MIEVLLVTLSHYISDWNIACQIILYLIKF